MTKKYLSLFTLTIFATLFSATVNSAEMPNQPLEVTVSTKKVFIKGSKEEKIEAVRADIGDVIEYSLSYKNVSTDIARDVKAALPIPDGYTYIQGSALPSLSNASKGGYLVWNIGQIKPKSSVSVSAKMRLSRVPKS